MSRGRALLQGPAEHLPQSPTGSKQPQSQDHHCRERMIRLPGEGDIYPLPIHVAQPRTVPSLLYSCTHTCFLCPDQPCEKDRAGRQ